LPGLLDLLPIRKREKAQVYFFASKKGKIMKERMMMKMGVIRCDNFWQNQGAPESSRIRDSFGLTAKPNRRMVSKSLRASSFSPFS
jgi:hypothetical protein